MAIQGCRAPVGRAVFARVWRLVLHMLELGTGNHRARTSPSRRLRCRQDRRMSRDRSRSKAETPPARPTGSTLPLEGALVGYRLLRRIASGERADVYLAAVGSADAG